MSDIKPRERRFLTTRVLVFVIVISMVMAWLRFRHDASAMADYWNWLAGSKVFVLDPLFLFLELCSIAFAYYWAFRPGGSIWQDGERLGGVIIGTGMLVLLLLLAITTL